MGKEIHKPTRSREVSAPGVSLEMYVGMCDPVFACHVSRASPRNGWGWEIPGNQVGLCCEKTKMGALLMPESWRQNTSLHPPHPGH